MYEYFLQFSLDGIHKFYNILNIRFPFNDILLK